MKFAMNYSHPAASLLQSGDIQLDYFKLPDWPEAIREANAFRPVHVHFTIIVGRGETETIDLDHVEHTLQNNPCRYVNVHIIPNANKLGISFGTRNPADLDAVARITVEDLAPLLRRFGSDRVILESPMWNPHAPNFVPLGITEPFFFNRMIKETGCGFLLDVAHAVASARHLGMDEREYLELFPTDKIRELHVTGLVKNGHGLWDDHYSMTDEDWILTEWSVDQIRSGRWSRPWIMTFEYGGIGALFESRCDPEVIRTQVPRLYQMAHSIPDPE